jgi:hypothetical protein
MSWIENRIAALESRVEYAVRYLQDLTQQVLAAAQTARQVAANYPVFSSGGSGGAYTCLPTAAVNGAIWGDDAPISGTSFTADVWQWNGTTPTALGPRNCINTLVDGLLADQPCPCTPDGNGNFVTISQGCTPL